VHRNSVWIRNQLDVTFMLSFISPLHVAQHVSGNHVPIFRSWRLRSVVATCWYCAVTMSGIIQVYLNNTTHCYSTIPTRGDNNRQLLKMGTWLPETCWATCKGEIKDNTKVTSSWFLIHIFLTVCPKFHMLHRQTYYFSHIIKTKLGPGWVL